MLLGGFGFLSRLHGLSIDNLVEVEMVLADGRIVIVSENEYPGKSLHSIVGLLILRKGVFIRFMVGCSGCRSLLRHRHAVQGKGLPCTCCICGKPHLVSIFFRLLTWSSLGHSR